MPEIDVATVLRAEGIAPAGTKAPKDERTGNASARAYAHPALPGRVVVRLSTDAVAPGVDVEMETLGFGAPDVTPKIGVMRERALGFPGWPLVNDPPHAKFALEVMKEFKKAAARARSKPGAARDAFVAIATRLSRSVPHFLPSFWEEAGRAFLAEGSDTFAAQSFEKARLAEKEHALEVDEEARGASFLEFTLAGAVNVKSLVAYAKILVGRYGEAEGYERFLELVRRRTLGGMAPWAGFAKELRGLAKAAKKDVAKEDERFLSDVLGASAIQRAPADFWKDYEPALVRLAKGSAEVRDRLRRLFPTASKDGFKAHWIALLESSGSLEAVLATSGAEAQREAHGMAADWLEKLVAYAMREPATTSLLERMAPRLIAEGVDVQLAQGSRYWAQLGLDLVELALAKKIPLATPPERTTIALQRHGDRALFTCDPVLTAADPRFATLLVNAVGGVAGTVQFEEAAKGKKGFVAARRDWLLRLVARAKDGTVQGLEDALELIVPRTRADMFVEFPEARVGLEAISAEACLARSLRGGLAAELAWPVFEAAVTELGRGHETVVSGAFPHAVLTNGARAIVVDHERRVLEHDLRLPPKARNPQLRFVPDDTGGGQLVVSFWDQESSAYSAYWSGKPDETFPFAHPYRSVNSGIPVPGGGITYGARAFRPGDTQVEIRDLVLSDGTKFYSADRNDGHFTLFEIDPVSGQKREAKVPAPIAATLPEGSVLVSAHLDPAAGVTRSPLGVKDGLVGRWVVKDTAKGTTTLHRIDGATRVSTATSDAPNTLLSMPGANAPQLASDQSWRGQVTLFDVDGRSLGEVKNWAAGGWKRVPALHFWNNMQPRDERGSADLRALDDARAAAILAATLGDAGAKTQPATRAAIAKHLPGVKSAELVEGVVALVEHAASIARMLGDAVKERIDPGAVKKSVGEGLPGDDALVTAFHDLVRKHGWSTGEVTRQVLETARALEEGGTVEAESSIHWELFLGSVRGLAVRMLHPEVTDDDRKTIRAFLEAWRSSLFGREPGRIRVLRGTISDVSPIFRRTENAIPGSWVAEDGASRFFVRLMNRSTSLTAGVPRPAHVVERTTDGTFRVPPGFVVVQEHRSEEAEAAWLEAFDRLVEERGIPTWSPDAAAELASQSGLTRTEAIYLWAGLPSLGDSGANWLDKSLRERLGISMSEAKVARPGFTSLDHPARLSLLADSAPAAPALLWDPLATDGPVARLAKAWVARSGRRVALREDAIALVETGLQSKQSAASLLAALVEPGSSRILAPPATPDTFDGAFAYHPRGVDDRLSTAFVNAAAMLVPFLFGELPVGDAYRDALPAFVEAVQKRTRAPGTLFPLISTYGEAKNNLAILEATGGKPVEMKDVNEARDNGIVLAALTSNGSQLRMAVHMDRLPRLADADDVWKLQKSVGQTFSPIFAAAFLEEHAPAFLERIAKTPVAKGGFEANPLLSAPKVVAAIAKKHGLSEEAAMLYAQLLALGEPTAKRVQAFNGWKPAAYKKAEAELVAAKLVVQGKRERAGREIFLPGGWDKSTTDLPQESWKASLFVHPRAVFEQRLPPVPLHVMFENAWNRVASGDAPKFEEV